MHWVVKCLYFYKNKKWGERDGMTELGGDIFFFCHFWEVFILSDDVSATVFFLVMPVGILFYWFYFKIVASCWKCSKFKANCWFLKIVFVVFLTIRNIFVLWEMTLSCMCYRLIIWMKMRSIFSVKLLIGSLEEDLGKSTKKGSDKQLLILLTLILWGNHLYLEATIR